MDNEDYVKELLSGLDPEKVREILASMKPTRQARVRRVSTEHGTCTQYTEYVKHTSCITCHSRYTQAYQLPNKETTTYMNKDGMPVCVVGRKGGKVEIEAYVQYCSSCERVVNMMPRFELERKYLDLLKRVALKDAL